MLHVQSCSVFLVIRPTEFFWGGGGGGQFSLPSPVSITRFCILLE